MSAAADALMGIFGFKRVESEMKTDRELLELAAKAAGYEVQPHPNRKSIPRLQFVSQGKNWNPLTDDGDALRLAHALGMQLNLDVCNDMNDVRTDIVCAAAAIGEGME